MKYYVDTCVWRDFFEYRLSKSGRNLGRAASNFLLKMLKENETIIFSDVLIFELKKRFRAIEIEQMLAILFLTKSLKKIETKKEEIIEAKKLSDIRKLPFADCLIAIQARNHKAIVVSQDRHFTENLSDIAQVINPKD